MSCHSIKFQSLIFSPFRLSLSGSSLVGPSVRIAGKGKIECDISFFDIVKNKKSLRTSKFYFYTDTDQSAGLSCEKALQVRIFPHDHTLYFATFFYMFGSFHTTTSCRKKIDNSIDFLVMLMRPSLFFLS